MSKTIKAREHHGAESLDLTIPTEVVRERDLSPNDVFKVEVKDEGGKRTYARL